MASNAEPRRFTIIGENIHATRTLARTGRHVISVGDGTEVVAFVDARGATRTMPLAAPIAAGSELAAGKVKHIRNALLLGLGGAGAVPRRSPGRCRQPRRKLAATTSSPRPAARRRPGPTTSTSTSMRSAVTRRSGCAP